MDRPPVDAIRGSKAQGRYIAQPLPGGWKELLDEASVTKAISELEGGPEWPCFVKFYTGAMTVYHGIKQSPN